MIFSEFDTPGVIPSSTICTLRESCYCEGVMPFSSHCMRSLPVPTKVDIGNVILLSYVGQLLVRFYGLGTSDTKHNRLLNMNYERPLASDNATCPIIASLSIRQRTRKCYFADCQYCDQLSERSTECALHITKMTKSLILFVHLFRVLFHPLKKIHEKNLFHLIGAVNYSQKFSPRRIHKQSVRYSQDLF